MLVLITKSPFELNLFLFIVFFSRLLLFYIQNVSTFKFTLQPRLMGTINLLETFNISFEILESVRRTTMVAFIVMSTPIKSNNKYNYAYLRSNINISKSIILVYSFIQLNINKYIFGCIIVQCTFCFRIIFDVLLLFSYCFTLSMWVDNLNKNCDWRFIVSFAETIRSPSAVLWTLKKNIYVIRNSTANSFETFENGLNFCVRSR